MSSITESFFPADGRAVIVAMDHGITGIHTGFESPETTLKEVCSGAPDGILITPSFARRFEVELNKHQEIRIITRMDFITFSTTAEFLGDVEVQVPIASVSEAVRLGANAVCAYLVFGREDHKLLEDNISYLSRLSEDAHFSGIALVVEVVFWGKKSFSGLKPRPDMMANAYRIAFEIGADVLKIPYMEDRVSFAKMMGDLPIPCLILGGSKMGTDEDVLDVVKMACEDGAKGVIFGRNIWQHDSPARLIRALHAIVHDDISIGDALNILR